MYYCEHCGEKFKKPGVYHTSYEAYYGVAYLPGRHGLTIDVCPECGSEEIVIEEQGVEE